MVSQAAEFDESLDRPSERQKEASGGARLKAKRQRPRDPPMPQASAVGKSDKPASNDHLDRKNYVTAIAALILNPRTQAPLTIGIYGPWGSGKSSFLAQLKASLPKRYLVASFNPWRLSGNGEVWAGLVGEIAPVIDRHLGFFQRLKFLWSSDNTRTISKFRTRLSAASKKVSNWLTVATASGGILASGYLQEIIAKQLPDNSWIGEKLKSVLAALGTYDLETVKWSTVVEVAGILVLVVFVLAKVARTLSRPFSTQFKANMSEFKDNTQNLKSVTFKDFESLRKAVGDFTTKRSKLKQPPLILLIDDLDRCSPDRVVSVLEAVNQFIAELPIITVFAIDTKFVCSAVAARHRFLFTTQSDSAEVREQYGRLFLEKIIHIPFQLPAVRSYERYVDELLTISAEGPRVSDVQKPAPMPRWDEVRVDRGTLQKVAAAFLYGYLAPFIRVLSLSRDIDQRWMLSITARLAFGLTMTDEQRAWLTTQDDATQVRVNFQEAELRGRLLNPISVSKAVRLAQQEVLASAIRIEENDRGILRNYLSNLHGNPRSIKRFVNTYLLAKGINALATVGKRDELGLEAIAAWLVLLQCWPRAASKLCGQALVTQSEPTFTDDWVNATLSEQATTDLIIFVRSNRQRLENLARSQRGLDIARCFSFFMVEA